MTITFHRRFSFTELTFGMSDKNRKDKVSNKSIEEGRTTRSMAAKQLTLAMLVAELEKNRNNITEELTKLIKMSLSPI